MVLKQFVLAALIAFAPLANGQNHGVKVAFDPAQTVIHWKLSGDLHDTHGTFKLKSGQIIFDPQTGVVEGELLVDATSGESGNATRDKHMQEEVLESNRYPAIFFHPSQLKGAYRDTAETQDLVGSGTFNIHGADHPLEMPLKVQVAGGAVTVTTRFAVPYVAWGMKDPSKFVFRVGKEVEVEVTARGKIQ